MPDGKDSAAYTLFDITSIARNFPPDVETLLMDTRLTDESAASARVFRIYRPVPPHFHATCDEYLYVVAGRGRFFIGDDPAFEVSPGKLLFFKKGVVHGMTVIDEHPMVFMSVDTPRRDPADVHFVNPADGTPETFIQTRRLY